MAPDLNSLPPSRSPEGAAAADSAAAATASSPGTNGSPLAASAHRPRQSPTARPSMRLNLHELPPGGRGSGGAGTGSTGGSGSGHPSPRSPINAAVAYGDPHHQRAPSLGELHQELEQEQEAQVNRLLQMIRQQQQQLAQLQAHAGGASTVAASGTAIADEAVPLHQLATSHHSSPHSLRSRSRRSSRSSPVVPAAAGTALATAGVAARPGGGRSSSPRTPAPGPAPPRDDAAFYAAETQSLQRENQMLRVRIRELEMQVRALESGEKKDEALPAAASGETAPPHS